MHTDWAAHLDGGVSTFQQGDGEEDALLEDSVAGGIHDEVNDQIGRSFFIQVALHLCQAHLSSAQASHATESYRRHSAVACEYTLGNILASAANIGLDCNILPLDPNPTELRWLNSGVKDNTG